MLVLRQLVRNERVVPLLSAVFHDPSEHSQVLNSGMLSIFKSSIVNDYEFQSLIIKHEIQNDLLSIIYVFISSV